MTTLTKRRNRSMYPSLSNDWFSDRFFGPGLMDFDNGFWGRHNQVPPANISENQNEYSIDLSAPGLERGDFKVEVDDNTLTISCEKEESKDDKESSRREFSYHSFSRSFQLPDNAVDEKISAKYNNGMLHVVIPKKEVSMGRSKKAITVS